MNKPNRIKVEALQKESSGYHTPVMLEACLAGLSIDPGGTYVDATFGGGGHSEAILKRLKGGRLIAFDQDEDAKKQADRIDHRSLIFCQANFRFLKKYLKLHGVAKVQGVLADLGVSSHQIDSPGRGFSTRFDGPLDMRMNQRSSVTAAGILNTYSEDDLHRILGMYGELRNAKTAAKALVAYRVGKKFAETRDLKDALAPFAPRGKENRYFAQVFQALRIEVNEEMKALEDFLHQCGEVIAPGGRLVVLSYHSLEDRMVKNMMQKGKVYGELEKDFYGNPIKIFEAVNRKPLVPDEAEILRNSRARSARLRVAVKL